MVPLIKLTDQSKKTEVSLQQLSSENVARTLLDAIALLGDVNCELIQRRRDLIRPDLNNQYQQICAEHVGFTDLLFDISVTNRIGQKLQNTNKASENHHRKSQFSKNGQTHRPQDTNPIPQDTNSLPQGAGESRSKAIAVHSVSVSKELTYVVSKIQTVIQSAGRIKHHLEQWGKLTSDPHI